MNELESFLLNSSSVSFAVLQFCVGKGRKFRLQTALLRPSTSLNPEEEASSCERGREERKEGKIEGGLAGETRAGEEHAFRREFHRERGIGGSTAGEWWVDAASRDQH